MTAQLQRGVIRLVAMNLNEVKRILARDGIHLTKSLGQNFLHDRQQLTRIVDAAELTPNDSVLEIGPGLGPLTERLLETGASVLAVEVDRRLVELLKKRFNSQPRLSVLHADALRYLQDQPRDWTGWKLVSNLPYSVASPILVELAKTPQPPERLVVTLQWEVAQRLVASPDSDDYGVLTLLVQLAFEPRSAFKISAQCFFPVPGVDSACVPLIRRKQPLLPRDQFGAFEKIVKRGFSQRRKMMIKLLKADWPLAKLEAALGELGLSPQIRAEKVSLDQFVRLTQMLPAEAESQIVP